MKSGGKKCTLSPADKPALTLPFIITVMARSPTEQFTFNPCQWCTLLKNLDRGFCLSLFFLPTTPPTSFFTASEGLEMFQGLTRASLHNIKPTHKQYDVLLPLALRLTCSKLQYSALCCHDNWLFSWNASLAVVLLAVCYGGPESSVQCRKTCANRHNTSKWRTHLHCEKSFRNKGENNPT